MLDVSPGHKATHFHFSGAFEPRYPRLFSGDLDLRSEDRDLVFALGGGHPRTMVYGWERAVPTGGMLSFELRGARELRGKATMPSSNTF